MLENLYTTKMSANKKTLQNRFTKIRRKCGQISKIMAAVMSCAVAVTMLGATIVMAAVGSDGLEHFTKNEIYYRDGMQFTINVQNKYVPDWLKNNIAAEDGNIKCTLSRYEMREASSGIIRNVNTLGFVGGKGQQKLAWLDGYSIGSEIHKQLDSDKYTGLQFLGCKDYNPLSTSIGYNLYKKLGVEPTDYECTAAIYFTLNTDNSLKNVFIGFPMERTLNEDLTYTDTGESMDWPVAQNLEIIGNIEEYIDDESKMMRYNGYFASFETNYENLDVDGYNIKIISADENKITVNCSLTANNAECTDILVFDDKHNIVAQDLWVSKNHSAGELKNYDVFPIKGKSFEKGKKYSVQLSFHEHDFDNFLYRWQEYVTVQ